MGIVNVTPDSFSDGGHYFNPDAAWEQALTLIAQGADILDIGGESARPGAKTVTVEEELKRVIPLIKRLHAEQDICLSIDTCKAAVMRAAVAAGAGMINDVAALSEDESLKAAAELRVPVCLMHRQGTPLTMQQNPFYYKDVVDDVNDFFQERIDRCVSAGLPRENLILDPGFGMGKSVSHNLKLINQLQQFARHNLPILLGVSRKSTLGIILHKPVGGWDSSHCDCCDERCYYH
jgi:dihydropteroate synthase